MSNDLAWWMAAVVAVVVLGGGLAWMVRRGRPYRRLWVATAGVAMVGLACVLEGVEAAVDGAVWRAVFYGVIVGEAAALIIVNRRTTSGQRGGPRRA